MLGRKPPKDIEDETLIMAYLAEKAIVQVRESVKDLLQGKPTSGAGDELPRVFSDDTWTHDFRLPLNSQSARVGRQFRYTRRRSEAHGRFP